MSEERLEAPRIVEVGSVKDLTLAGGWRADDFPGQGNAYGRGKGGKPVPGIS
ncbi:lasso RiPP family leader peptide-containing protein [Georgenia yuyongxinii]